MTAGGGGLAGHTIALKALVDGDYVCADNAGASPLIANASTVGTAETFTPAIVR